MKAYLDLVDYVLKNGSLQENRTSINSKSVFSYTYKVNLQDGFPLLTTKKVHFKSVLVELLWFLKGDTNIKYLVDNGVRIWNEWPYENFKKCPEFNGETIEEFAEKIKTDNDFAMKHGDLGPVYGKMWRDYEANGKAVDQISFVINEIKTNPRSRRLIVNAWNPCLVEKQALPPCHVMFQFYVTNNNELSLQLYQRSADVFLGVPFNLASYSLLLEIVAKICDLKPLEFIHVIGDAHLYENHLEQAEVQISRTPLKRCSINFPKKDSIFDYEINDFEIIDYKNHGVLKGSVAV